MTAIFIVPTGVGATIGGHAGDATPALKVIAEAAGRVITHPNVVNASAINEMPENCLYVEGFTLDSFLECKTGLREVRSNRILVVVNSPIDKYATNLCAAASATIGAEICIEELETPLKMRGWLHEGEALGEHSGCKELIHQVSRINFDALAILTPISVDTEVAYRYFLEGGTNPWGAVEAMVSREISQVLEKQVAHAPLESLEAIEHSALMNVASTDIIDPRMAAEAVSSNYAHCVLKGLHRAPRWCGVDRGISLDEITCLVSPAGVVGPPHWACEKLGIPIIVVEENQTIFDAQPRNYILVKNYLEAAGIISMLKAGVTIESVTRTP